MKEDLHGLRILVTRPEPKGSELCSLIERHGGHAIHFPTIVFTPPPGPDLYQQAIHTLGDQDWLIFSSPQSVYTSIPAIRKEWPQFPPQVKFAAVGAGTVAALHEAGYTAAIYPTDPWSAEGLLAMAEFQSVAGNKIAIFRGEGGRGVLDQVLTIRGAQVTPVIAYRRSLPNVTICSYITLLEQQAIDMIISTSGEGVQNLKILLGNAGWPYLRKIPLLVVSERIKILARDLDFQTIWVARNARHDTILEVLALKVL
jgi:uroporphyrinogen-III synthase